MVQFKDLIESNVKIIFSEALLDEKNKKKTNDGEEKDDKEDKDNKKSDKSDKKKDNKKDDKKDKDSSKDSEKTLELDLDPNFKDNIKLLAVSTIHPALGLGYMGLKTIGMDPLDSLQNLIMPMSEENELTEKTVMKSPYEYNTPEFTEWVKSKFGPTYIAHKTDENNADLYDAEGLPLLLLVNKNNSKNENESKENSMKQESMIDTIIRNVLTEGKAGVRRYPDTGIIAADLLNVLHHQYKLIGAHVDESQDLETKKKIFVVSGLNDLDKDLPKTLKVDFVELKLLPKDEAKKMNAGMATSNYIYVIDKLDDEYPLENERV